MRSRAHSVRSQSATADGLFFIVINAVLSLRGACDEAISSENTQALNIQNRRLS